MGLTRNTAADSTVGTDSTPHYPPGRFADAYSDGHDGIEFAMEGGEGNSKWQVFYSQNRPFDPAGMSSRMSEKEFRLPSVRVTIMFPRKN